MSVDYALHHMGFGILSEIDMGYRRDSDAADRRYDASYRSFAD